MHDYLEIGSTPANEDCVQVGAPDYARLSRMECNTFIHQILRICGVPPEGASLVIRSNPHDFGTYYEVAVRYDDGNEAAEAYAYDCESSAPTEWDDEARQELIQAGYPIETQGK